MLALEDDPKVLTETIRQYLNPHPEDRQTTVVEFVDSVGERQQSEMSARSVLGECGEVLLGGAVPAHP